MSILKALKARKNPLGNGWICVHCGCKNYPKERGVFVCQVCGRRYEITEVIR